MDNNTNLTEEHIFNRYKAHGANYMSLGFSCSVHTRNSYMYGDRKYSSAAAAEAKRERGARLLLALRQRA
jgi:hypothetical protein